MAICSLTTAARAGAQASRPYVRLRNWRSVRATCEQPPAKRRSPPARPRTGEKGGGVLARRNLQNADRLRLADRRDSFWRGVFCHAAILCGGAEKGGGRRGS